MNAPRLRRSRVSRACANGHPWVDGDETTPASYTIKKHTHTRKADGAKVTYEYRHCSRCRRPLDRIRARNLRAAGKQSSYPQWVAAKGEK